MDASSSRGSEGPLHKEGSVVFQVDNEMVNALCCCPLMAPDIFGRPVVAAAQHSGILEFATQVATTAPLQKPVKLEGNNAKALSGATEETQEAGGCVAVSGDYALSAAGGEGPLEPLSPDPDTHAGGGGAGGGGGGSSTFSQFLSQIFDQISWATDPFERSHSAMDGDFGLAVAGAMASATSGSATPASPSPRVSSRVVVVNRVLPRTRSMRVSLRRILLASFS